MIDTFRVVNWRFDLKGAGGEPTGASFLWRLRGWKPGGLMKNEASQHDKQTSSNTLW